MIPNIPVMSTQRPWRGYVPESLEDAMVEAYLEPIDQDNTSSEETSPILLAATHLLIGSQRSIYQSREKPRI